LKLQTVGRTAGKKHKTPGEDEGVDMATLNRMFSFRMIGYDWQI
jgi:hypothetical protein